MKKDYYEILGVKQDATTEEIVSAYKKLAMKYHPDRQQGKTDAEKKEAEEKFKECSEAAEVLRDPDKRAKYDRFGADGQAGGFSFDFGGDGFDPMKFFREMHGGMDMAGFGHFGDFSFGWDHGGGGPPGGGGFDPDAPEDGADWETAVDVTFKESVLGCRKDLTVGAGEPCRECGGSGVEKGTKPHVCPTCGGAGHISKVTRTGMMVHRVITPCGTCRGVGVSIEPCKACGGSGRAPKNRSVSVSIPAGAQNGTRLRLKGCGQCGVKGGRDGDLYVSVRVGSSPVFDRRGLDVYFTAHVSPAVMALGGRIRVPTLYPEKGRRDGYREMKIEPGTQAGARLKVPGYGIRTPAGQTGCMVITIVPEIPSGLSKDERKAWEAVLEKSRPGPLAAAAEKAADEFYSE